MSAETKAALDKAIRDHIADESPDKPLLMGWVLATEVTGMELSSHEVGGGGTYFLDNMDGLANSSSLGISEFNYRRRSHING